MEIKGKVHCFFEQSGTFKNEFRKLGYDAYDYDIQNEFGETDFVRDLFVEIDNAYEGRPSLFDSIPKDDLIIAFYPCIFFSATSQIDFHLSCKNYRKMSMEERFRRILLRSDHRQEFYNRLIKFCAVCVRGGQRMIFENPWSENTYLKANFIKAPDVVDMNRRRRGDYFVKPTAYWYWNCKPTEGESYEVPTELKTHMTLPKHKIAGMCSEARSTMAPAYARNFICDFILGKPQENSQLSLF